MKPRPKKKYLAVIDASELFESEQIKEYDFGEVDIEEVDIEEVQICEMGVKEVNGEIRYRSVGGFSLTSMEEKMTGTIVVESDKPHGEIDDVLRS
jgi:hypothetical protein